MPITYTVPTSGSTVEALTSRALESIPPDARSATRPREELKAIVWSLALVECQLATWIRMLFIATAVGPWLDQHGEDRDMGRRNGEDDDAYRARMPQVADANTAGSVAAAADAVLAGAGVAGSAYVVEIWRDAIFCDLHFCDSERVLGPGPAMVVILPAATPESVARSVYDATRATKSAGVYILVFPSLTGGKP